MQLSKQQFNKLSKADKAMLLSQNLNSKRKIPNRPKKSFKKANNLQRNGVQASVAAAYATRSVGKPPLIRATRDTCNIKHREFLSNVTGSVAFAISNTLALNPGLPATFPWLSLQAQGWEEYRFRSLKICYLTRTGSTTPGSVLIAPDYDSSDGPPLSEQIMSSYAQVVEDAPWKDIECVLKPPSMNNNVRHFVRTGPLAANQDIKLYDIANLFVGVVDGTAVAWGKLWIEYDIDFYIPQLPSGGASLALGGLVNGADTMTAVNPLGLNPVVDPSAQGFTVNNASTVTFSVPGTYLFNFDVVGTVITDLSLTIGGGGTFIAAFKEVIETGALNAVKTIALSTVIGTTVICAATATTITGSKLQIASAPSGSFS
jgi:hypothetical protein